LKRKHKGWIVEEHATTLVEIANMSPVARGEQECTNRPRPVKTVLKVSTSGGLYWASGCLIRNCGYKQLAMVGGGFEISWL
jgi:hypothetical protein